MKKGHLIASRDRRRLLVLPLYMACAVAGTGCGGARDSRTVFDPAGSNGNAVAVDVTAGQLEHPYAALDATGAGGEPWIGVSIFGDRVRLSRPTRWTIRDASIEPEHSYIRYVSPDAYSFAIYERGDAPGKSWPSILEHYEADLTANGAKALGQHVPVATATNQGIAYTIDRKIEGKDPILSRSREWILRGNHRIVVVQVVTQEESLARISGELLEIFRRLEVL